MRLLVISDVHSDAASLERVLAHSRKQGWDEVVFLGDAVGYGAEAAATLSILRSLPLRAGIKGNHEAMLELLREGRVPNASRGVVQTLSRNLAQLGPDDLTFLDRLAPIHLDGSWGAAHGALRKPYEYLLSVPTARSNASHMKRDIYFVGHTHVAAAYLQASDGEWQLRAIGPKGGRIPVPEVRAFLNPGSVALPRDGTAGPSYGIYDEEEREFVLHRVGVR